MSSHDQRNAAPDGSHTARLEDVKASAPGRTRTCDMRLANRRHALAESIERRPDEAAELKRKREEDQWQDLR